MAKLHYKYATMGAGKSLDLIRTAYNYKERGMNPLVFKPDVDTRDIGENGSCIIKSRTGASCEAEWIKENDNIANIVSMFNSHKKVDVVIVDEVQFLTCKQIMQLSNIVTELEIPVLAYGLKTNFKGELFEPIKTLLAYCDDIQEIRSLCFCGKRANHNARVVEGNVIKHGKEIQIGGNEKYVALCNKHFKEGIIKER